MPLCELSHSRRSWSCKARKSLHDHQVILPIRSLRLGDREVVPPSAATCGDDGAVPGLAEVASGGPAECSFDRQDGGDLLNRGPCGASLLVQTFPSGREGSVVRALLLDLCRDSAAAMRRPGERLVASGLLCWCSPSAGSRARSGHAGSLNHVVTGPGSVARPGDRGEVRVRVRRGRLHSGSRLPPCCAALAVLAMVMAGTRWRHDPGRSAVRPLGKESLLSNFDRYVSKYGD